MTSWAYGATVAHIMEHKSAAGSWPGGWVSRCQYNLTITWEQVRVADPRRLLNYLSPWGGEEPELPWCRRCVNMAYRDAYATLFADDALGERLGRLIAGHMEIAEVDADGFAEYLGRLVAGAMETGSLWRAS